MLEFGLPRGVWRPLWELYVRVGLPLAGAVVSPGWREVGGFLGPSIRGFYERAAAAAARPLARAPASPTCACRRLSLGGGVVVWGTRVSDDARPAFYALRSGGWRDYVTLLHPPYTLWHLSYVALGAALAPHMKWGLLGWTALAFLLAMGVGAHALDELKGRPLRTRIPDRVLVALAAVVDRRRLRDRHRRRDRVDAVAPRVRRRSARAIVVAYNLELFGGRCTRRSGSRSRGARSPR